MSQPLLPFRWFLCRGRPRSLLLGLLLLAVALTYAQRASAQRKNDPVQDFRDALKSDKDTARSKEALEYRKDNLEKAAKKLVYLGDIAQALLLIEWRADSSYPEIKDVDGEVRKGMTARFENGIKDILQLKDADSSLQAAGALLLLRESAANARSVASPSGFYVRGRIGELAPDVIKVIENLQADERVREVAVTALGQIEPKPDLAVPVLEKQLHSSSAVVRRAAARALSDLIQVATTADKKRSTILESEQVKQRLIQTGALVVAAAAQGLESSDAEVRWWCASACRSVATTAVELVREPYVANTFPPVGRKGLTNDEKAEIRRSQQYVEGIRKQVGTLLAPFQKAMPVLARLSANDPDVGIRVQTRHILEEVATTRQRLVKLSASVPPLDSEAGAPEARLDTDLPFLPLPAEPNLFVLVGRPIALRDEQPKEAKDDPLGDSLRGTLTSLKSGLADRRDVRARLASLDALEALGDDAAPALPELIAALSDSDKFVRWSAARTIGKLAQKDTNRTAVAKLASLVSESDLDVRIAAISALERYGPNARGAVSQLGNAVNQGDPESRIAVMKALQSIGDDAVPVLSAVGRNLTEDNVRVRQTACETLGYFGVKARSMAPALQQALIESEKISRQNGYPLADPEADVRRAAGDALLKVLAK